MTSQEILSALQKQFPDLLLAIQKGDAGDEWLLVPSVELLPVMQFLNTNLGMDFLACLSGVDYQDHFAVVYQLRSLKGTFELMVKVLLDHDKPEVKTMSGLWANADWFEREAYDLLGISFIKHPDLRRLMMPKDWVGHPLRKDYQEQSEYHGISTTRPDTHKVMNRFYSKNGKSVSTD
jgi:NADH-quinone oxidoreductase subunit C